MQTQNIQDKYNTAKVWLIKKSPAGHYFMNQAINNKTFYPAYTRTTKKHLLNIGLNVTL